MRTFYLNVFLNESRGAALGVGQRSVTTIIIVSSCSQTSLLVSVQHTNVCFRVHSSVYMIEYLRDHPVTVDIALNSSNGYYRGG